MKKVLVQLLLLSFLFLSTNNSYALIYDYKYQGNMLTTLHNGNNLLPQYTGGNYAVSFELQLSQALPADPANFDPSTVLLVSAWDGTQLVSTEYGASYSISMTTDPATNIPPLGGFWRVSAWQSIDGGTHTISTYGNGWAGAPGSWPEGSDEARFVLADDIFNPWTDNSSWNNTNPGTWSMSVLPDGAAPVPEPSMLLLSSLGLAGLFLVRKILAKADSFRADSL